MVDRDCDHCDTVVDLDLPVKPSDPEFCPDPFAWVGACRWQFWSITFCVVRRYFSLQLSEIPTSPGTPPVQSTI
jgi:hypothetical protein